MKNKTTQNNRKQIRERRNSKRKKKAKQLMKEKLSTNKNMIYQILSVITNIFPWFFDELREIEDLRRLSEYELAELIMAAIAMNLLKEGSRNAMNNDRNTDNFKSNYEKTFKMKLPHMDTVDAVFRVLEGKLLEKLKESMVKALFKRKIFRRQRFQDYYIIAIDATGVQTFNEPNDFALHKTSKNGKKSYFVNVLEAKLVTYNGFSISIATEWIDNKNINEEYNKQDCELEAFKRMAIKLKKEYSHLKICIAADGLYPNQGFFDICKQNKWKFIITFKDGNLKTLWKEINKLKKNNKDNCFREEIKENNKEYLRDFSWLSKLKYRNHSLNFLECIEEEINSKGNKKFKKFAHLTNFSINNNNISATSTAGRLRWKIENEGFNIQKNHGYAMKHKYSRISYTAIKNYYQCLQIGHIINQRTEINSKCQNLLIEKMTICHLWKYAVAFLLVGVIDVAMVESILTKPTIFRFG